MFICLCVSLGFLFGFFGVKITIMSETMAFYWGLGGLGWVLPLFWGLACIGGWVGFWFVVLVGVGSYA